MRVVKRETIPEFTTFREEPQVIERDPVETSEDSLEATFPHPPTEAKRWGVHCPYIGFTFWYDDPDVAASRAIEYEGEIIED